MVKRARGFVVNALGRALLGEVWNTETTHSAKAVAAVAAEIAARAAEHMHCDDEERIKTA